MVFQLNVNIKAILNIMLIAFIMISIMMEGLVVGNDVDFGSCPLNPGYLVDCTISLDVDCDENCNTGIISSPYYPDRMPDIDYWGKVYIIIITLS